MNVLLIKFYFEKESGLVLDNNGELNSSSANSGNKY